MGGNLRFRRLRLRNWRNFSSIEVAVPDRLCLIGPNASGKSNFLDVFRFLRDLAAPGGGFQEAVARRGGVSTIRCLAARRQSEVEIGVELTEGKGGIQWNYELGLTQDRQRGSLVCKERVLRDCVELIKRPGDEDYADPERLTQTSLEQVSANRTFRELAAFFASIRYLHIVPQLIRDPDRSGGGSNDPFGSDFLEQAAGVPDRTRNARLRRIGEALQMAVPQLEAIDLWRDSRGTPHLRGKYRHWRPRGAWQTEEQFSDGTLRLIGLFWSAMERAGPLLLEEPELSLHPGMVRALPKMLARVQRGTGRQTLLSTHSPELLRDKRIGFQQALVIIPGVEGAQAIPLESNGKARELLESGFSLAGDPASGVGPEHSGQRPLFGEG